MKAVIIDDESRSRVTLKNALKRYCPSVEVLAEAHSVGTGLDAIRAHQPELVFLDVEMPDGTGFDLLEKLKDHSFALIFTTAYDHYAMQAFRYSAVDYLQKPVDPDFLVEAVKKAGQERSSSDLSGKIEALLANRNGPAKLALPTGDGIRLVPVEDIVRCESDSNYTRIFTRNKEQILVTRTLKEYEELLTPQGFCRVHQSHVVNLRYVERFINRDSGYLRMEDGSQVEVSRRKKDEVLQMLTGR